MHVKMREIKYKAWSKRYNVLCEVEEIHWNTRTINVCYDNKSDWVGVTRERWKRRGEPLDEFILMEYTGKKDKNGNEIFDGHLLRYDNTEYQLASGIYLVSWSEDELAFVCEREKPYNYLLPSVWSEGEIIGHRCENKEAKA